MPISKDLLAASATRLVLSTLSQGDTCSYAIIRRVRAISRGRMQWNDGVLYPAVHRLKRQA